MSTSSCFKKYAHAALTIEFASNLLCCLKKSHVIAFTSVSWSFPISVGQTFDTVVTCMQTHPANTTAQLFGASFLSAVAGMSQHHDLVASRGGIAALTTTLRMHLHVPAIAEVGVRGLQQLVTHIAYHPAVVKLGGIELLIASLVAHPDAVAVHEHACEALKTLAVSQPAYRDVIPDKGGNDALVRSLGRHVEVATVVLPALQSLHTVAFKMTSQLAIVVGTSLDAPFDIWADSSVGITP